MRLFWFILVIVFLPISVAFRPRTAFPQCSWSHRKILDETTGRQPAITTFGNGNSAKLFLAHVSADKNLQVVIQSSVDGNNFGGGVRPSTFKSIFGAQIAGSLSCHSLFVAFVAIDPYKHLELSKSIDGIHWTSPVEAAYSLESTPSIADEQEGTSGVSFAYLVNNPDLADQPIVAVKTSNCDLSSLSNGSYCFFSSGACETFPASGSVAFARGNGLEIEAIAQPNGAPILQENIHARPISKEHSSDTGLSAAIDPVTKQGYLAWQESSGDQISLYNASTGHIETCDERATSVPSITFFRGDLWVAWRGALDNRINIGNMKPF